MAAPGRGEVWRCGGYLHGRPAFAEVGDLVGLAQQRGEHGGVGVCAAARTVPRSDRVSDAGDEGLVVVGGGALRTRLRAAVHANSAVREAAGRGVNEVWGGRGRCVGQSRATEPHAECPKGTHFVRCLLSGCKLRTLTDLFFLCKRPCTELK